MLKRLFLSLAFVIGVTHVLKIYLMPNCTYVPASKKSEQVNNIKTQDSASETPYKVKYRTLLCFKADNRFLLKSETLDLIAYCITFNINEFLFETPKITFHFNLSYLRVPPNLINAFCCLLI